ncbi:outer membrane protein [Helicobacter cynogastricus]|uniref:outer membrane protein n=1 Tax=Helicobacter cynogastricus TaxID=329937 RepID=UPI000CF07819|nr:outer membrane protein [Helicobacter cynogastricus]
MLVHRFIRKKLFVGALACCSLVSLSAGNNGGYFGIGVQYSNLGAGGSANDVFKSDGLDTATTDATSGNFFGMDFQLGYKQFFGKKKRFGMRYYAMFSAQGGPYSYPQRYSNDTYTLRNGALTNLFYGAGWDVLIDFYQNETRSFGIFGGIMLGGTSWLFGKSKGVCPNATYSMDTGDLSCSSTQVSYDQLSKQLGKRASYSPSYVQFAFNFGVRANVSKHNGLEVGVRAPVINTPYFINKDNPIANVELRRLVVIFINYVANF